MKRQTHFSPRFTITCAMAQDLVEIEKLRQTFLFSKNTKLKNLREKATRELCYYFRILENLERTAPDKKVLEGFLQALKQIHSWASNRIKPTQLRIQMLHAILMNEIKRSPFRKEQNAIFDATMTHILYMPPKAQDVTKLMQELLLWLKENKGTPVACLAGIVHFGINAIHPFHDGNGRTARLLTRWILKAHDYDLNGLYCLEKYYTKDLDSYYDALGLHGKKTYEKGAQKSDCTDWLAYFLRGMKQSFTEAVKQTI